MWPLRWSTCTSATVPYPRQKSLYASPNLKLKYFLSGYFSYYKVPEEIQTATGCCVPSSRPLPGGNSRALNCRTDPSGLCHHQSAMGHRRCHCPKARLRVRAANCTQRPNEGSKPIQGCKAPKNKTLKEKKSKIYLTSKNFSPKP